MAEAFTAYRCEHGCGHVRAKRAAVLAHEARCFRNPVTRSCQTCANRVPPEPADYDDRGMMTYSGCGWSCAEDCAQDGKPRTECPAWEAHGGGNG